MTNLSPAAQAVYEAGTTALWDSRGLNSESSCLAAALAAVADQVGQMPAYPINTEWDKGFVDGVRLVHRELLAIAHELKS